MATVQAKRAIAALLAAGYQRSEFSVQTERKFVCKDYRGRGCYEYGDAQIYIYASKSRQLDLVEKVAEQGIGSTIFTYKHKDGSQLVSYPIYEADAKNPHVERIDVLYGFEDELLD